MVVRTPPAWATKLVQQVAAEHGRKRPPRLVWSRSWRRSGVRELFASGGCNAGVVWVASGALRVDARAILLHELAHWLTWSEDAIHGPRFHAVRDGLFRRHRVPVRRRR